MLRNDDKSAGTAILNYLFRQVIFHETCIPDDFKRSNFDNLQQNDFVKLSA